MPFQLSCTTCCDICFFLHTQWSAHTEYAMMLVHAPLCMCTSIHCVHEPLPFLNTTLAYTHIHTPTHTYTHNTYALLPIWQNIITLSNNDGHPHAYCLCMLSSYMYSIPFNCCCACLCRWPLILFTQLSVLSVFFLCIVAHILVAQILCRSILFDNYSMYMLSSHTTGPSYMT